MIFNKFITYELSTLIFVKNLERNGYVMGKEQKSLVTQVQANAKMLRDNEKAMDRVRLENQCFCIHKDANGSFALIPPQGKNGPRNPHTGAPYYTCRLCHKKIDISRISEEEILKAIDTIDRQMDISKMQIDIENEKDRKMKRTLGKIQFKNITTVKDVHTLSVRGGNKKKKRRNSDDDLVETRRS